MSELHSYLEYPSVITAVLENSVNCESTHSIGIHLLMLLLLFGRIRILYLPMVYTLISFIAYRYVGLSVYLTFIPVGTLFCRILSLPFLR